MGSCIILCLLIGSILSAASWKKHVPQGYRTLRNPCDGSTAGIQVGLALYGDYCADCHGHGQTKRRKPPELPSPSVTAALPGELFWLLQNGLSQHGMPSFSFLSERERWQFVTFLKGGVGSQEAVDSVRK